MRAERHAHCLCGAVQIALRNPPHEIGACHCDMCRRWTGAALLTLDMAAEDVTITGAEAIRSYSSSDWAARYFCGTCGTSLYYRLKDAPAGQDQYYLAAGLLDDLSDMRLTREIFIDRKPDAFAFAGPTAQLTERQFFAALNASPEE